jgi:hypothetical protein
MLVYKECVSNVDRTNRATGAITDSLALFVGRSPDRTTFGTTCIGNATARTYARSPDIAAEPFHDGFLVYDRHAFEVVGYGATIDEAMEDLRTKEAR